MLQEWAHDYIYLTDYDEEAIVDFVKDHEELYYKTNEHFKDKERKKFFWEQFAKNPKLSVKVCKTWFDSQRTHYEKLTQSKYGQAPKDLDTIQVRIPEVTHQMQGAQQVARLQIASPRS